MDTHKEPDSQPAKQHGNDDGGFRQIYGRHIKKLAAGILVSLGKMFPKTPVQDKRERMSKDYHRIIKDVYKERSRYIKKNSVIPDNLRLIGKLPVQVLYYRRLFVYTWLVHNYRRKGSLVKFALSPFMSLTKRALSFLAKFVKGVLKGIWGFVKRAIGWVGRKVWQLFKWLGKITFKGIKAFFSKTYSFVKKCFGRINKIFNVGKNIHSAFGKVSTFLKGKFEKFFMTPFKKGVALIRAGYKKIKGFVFGVAKKGWDFVKKSFSTAKNWVKTKALKAANYLKGKYTKLKDWASAKVTSVKTALKPITDVIGKGVDKVKDFASGIKSTAKGIAKSVGAKVGQWKDSLFSFGKDVKDTGSSALNTLKKGWGKVKSGYSTAKSVASKYIGTPIAKTYAFGKKWGTKGYNLAKGMVKGGVKFGKGMVKLGRGSMRLLRKGVKLLPGAGVMFTAYFEKQDLDNWLNQLQAAKENNQIGQPEFKKYVEMLYMSSGAAVAAEISANAVTAMTGVGAVASGVAGVLANETARYATKKLLGTAEEINALQDALDKGETLLDEGYQVKEPQQANEELMNSCIDKMKTFVTSVLADVREQQLKNQGMKEAIEVQQLTIPAGSNVDQKVRIGYNPKVDAVIGMNGGFAI